MRCSANRAAHYLQRLLLTPAVSWGVTARRPVVHCRSSTSCRSPATKQSGKGRRDGNVGSRTSFRFSSGSRRCLRNREGRRRNKLCASEPTSRLTFRLIGYEKPPTGAEAIPNLSAVSRMTQSKTLLNTRNNSKAPRYGSRQAPGGNAKEGAARRAGEVTPTQGPGGANGADSPASGPPVAGGRESHTPASRRP